LRLANAGSPTYLATHAGGIEGRGCNQVGRGPTDVTTAGLLVKLRRKG